MCTQQLKTLYPTVLLYCIALLLAQCLPKVTAIETLHYISCKVTGGDCGGGIIGNRVMVS